MAVVTRRRRRGLGVNYTELAAGGTAAGLAVSSGGSNIPADVATVTNLVAAFGGGSQADAQRAARAQWFLSKAQQGNVAAAQCLLGGLNTVASHEQPMYQAAVTALQASALGAETWQSAVAAGPFWSLQDSAASYPNMTAFVNSYTPRSVLAIGTTAAHSPLLWIAGAGVLALVLMRRRT